MQLVTARFYCAVCNQQAAVLTLHEDGRLIHHGLMAEVTEVVPPAMRMAALYALEQAGPDAIYAVNKLWAAFYCPQCDAVYCKEHWQIELKYDDADPSWYDCAFGVCPHGHRRLIDD